MWCGGNVFGGGVLLIWGISVRGGTRIIVFGEVKVLPWEYEYSTVHRVESQHASHAPMCAYTYM